MAGLEVSMDTSKQVFYNVKRSDVEIIKAPESAPKEPLYLTNLDDQEISHDRTGSLFIYNASPSMAGHDPCKIVKLGLFKVLEYYYPFSGRLKKAANGKLVVDFTEEGVPFVEATADISLSELGELQPPFPCVKKLVYDISESESITDTPLLVVQVTAFRCGGFVVAVKLNEVMCDFKGYVKFLSAWGEMCRGANAPTVMPIWERNTLLSPRDPPRVSPAMTFHQYDPEPPLPDGTNLVMPMSEMCVCSCVLGPEEIRILKEHCTGQNPGARYTAFEVVLAFLWRSRVRAMGMEKEQEVRILFMVDARKRMKTHIPEGYYGSVVGMPCIKSTAGMLGAASLQEIAQMLRDAKDTVDEEFMRSTIDYLEIHKNVPRYPLAGTILATDLRNMHKDVSNIDFGWGSPLYGNGAFDGDGVVESCHCYMMPVKDRRDRVLVSFCLPPQSLPKFRNEYHAVFGSRVIRSRI